MEDGCRLMMEMLREAGFDKVARMPTDGHPGVFALLDAGAPRSLGVYFMYDVKQVDPLEWSSPTRRTSTTSSNRRTRGSKG